MSLLEFVTIATDMKNYIDDNRMDFRVCSAECYMDAIKDINHLILICLLNRTQHAYFQGEQKGCLLSSFQG